MLLVTTVYNNHYKWLPWLFESGPPADYWNNLDNKKLYLDWLGNKLSLKFPDDWYFIDKKVTSYH